MLEINTPYELPDGNVLTVEYDEMPENPRCRDRNFGNLGTFITFERRYNSPDENYFESFQDCLEVLKSGKYYYALVERYEHSLVKYSRFTGKLSDAWDSCVVGVIYVRVEDARKYFDMPTAPYDKLEDRVFGVFDLELKEYTQYCNGEIYAYVIEDEDGKTIDSCGGFYEVEDILWELNLSEDELK